MTNHLSFWWPADKDYYGVTNGLWLAPKREYEAAPKNETSLYVLHIRKEY